MTEPRPPDAEKDWNDDSKRTHVLKVELTHDEIANIEAAAVAAGLSFNAWMVRMATDDNFRATQMGAAANGNKR